MNTSWIPITRKALSDITLLRAAVQAHLDKQAGGDK